jgi:carboxyl-terminal processing protease
MRDGFVTVIAPLAGTPADSAGIRPGDVIIAIDRKTTHGLSMEEVQQAMRGPAGTRVQLTLERNNEHPVVMLTRREIVYHPVQHAYVANGIAYVELATFSEQAAQEVRHAIDSLRAAGGRSLILDLRGNPGGLLEEGLAVADLFIDAGKTIVSTRGRTVDADHDYADIAPQIWPTMPIVALVDSGSASAAEIVAGALQDNERAVLVGARTYGKGSAQSIFPVTDGNALKLTTARWFTPNGRTIARDSTGDGGIEPDIHVTPAERPRSAAQRDVALARAIGLLTGVSTPSQLRARLKK